jgi:hypothetical protein
MYKDLNYLTLNLCAVSCFSCSWTYFQIVASLVQPYLHNIFPPKNVYCQTYNI